jgi:hypothetical protein
MVVLVDFCRKVTFKNFIWQKVKNLKKTKPKTVGHDDDDHKTKII